MVNLNIFTCCNGVYKNFIPLFILSNLYYNQDCFVEVGVDLDDLTGSKPIKYLEDHFPNKFMIRDVQFNNFTVGHKVLTPMVNLVRFITEPTVKSKYVYISDVDIINLQQNIHNQHIKNIESNNLNYSNIVRDYNKDQKYKRLTGLHFTKYENYYPIQDYSNICEMGLFSHDEMFLYELMKKRHGKPNEEVKWRPVHGIHVSPNRKHDGVINWGLDIWEKQWKNFRNTEIFIGLEPLLTKYLRDKISIIDNHYQ